MIFSPLFVNTELDFCGKTLIYYCFKRFPLVLLNVPPAGQMRYYSSSLNWTAVVVTSPSPLGDSVSHFFNLHRLFFCHLEKCQESVQAGFAGDEAASSCCNLAGSSSMAGWACFHPADKLMVASLPGQENSFHHVEAVDYTTSLNAINSCP